MIACVTIPYFASTVMRRLNTELRSPPLILGEPPRAPERVYAVSPEAAEVGVKPGMALRQAQLLCPQGQVVPAQPGQEQATAFS
ncbi:MAG: hypothetical protein AB1801_28955 [Chloroflexota bacterium]